MYVKPMIALGSHLFIISNLLTAEYVYAFIMGW